MAAVSQKIRRPLGRLIFNMGIAIPGKTVFLIETAPKLQLNISVLWYTFEFMNLKWKLPIWWLDIKKPDWY